MYREYIMKNWVGQDIISKYHHKYNKIIINKHIKYYYKLCRILSDQMLTVTVGISLVGIYSLGSKKKSI